MLAAVFGELDFELISLAADEQERRVPAEEWVDRVDVLPYLFEVTLTGAPADNVLPQRGMFSEEMIAQHGSRGDATFRCRRHTARLFRRTGSDRIVVGS